MSVITTILGATSLIKSIFSLIDDANLTEQEKAEEKRKLIKSYEPYKVAQRLLALGFCYTFLFLVVCCFFASFFVDVSAQMELIKDNLWQIVLVIVGFYFAGGVIEGTISKTSDAVKKHHEAKSQAEQPRNGEKLGSYKMAEKHRENH